MIYSFHIGSIVFYEYVVTFPGFLMNLWHRYCFAVPKSSWDHYTGAHRFYI